MASGVSGERGEAIITESGAPAEPGARRGPSTGATGASAGPELRISLDLSKAIVTGRAWKLDRDDSDASFRSSNADLDRVRELCRYSIEATRGDLYTDTPTRERGPYEGDELINQFSEYGVQYAAFQALAGCADAQGEDADATALRGRSDAALALLTSTATNSWLHMLDALKATIVTEAWDPALKSNMTLSHAWVSAPANAVARHILGPAQDRVADRGRGHRALRTRAGVGPGAPRRGHAGKGDAKVESFTDLTGTCCGSARSARARRRCDARPPEPLVGRK